MPHDCHVAGDADRTAENVCRGGVGGRQFHENRYVIFGNPKLGTALMKCGHSVAIDLPLKALVWEDGDGQTWLGYNDPAFLAERHKLEGCDQPLEKMSKAVAGFAKAATQ